ncbi:MAG: GntR family transcriptional regulator [Pseudooceanicola sp.]|nr:GntR family transcriptional regulator [Pseudooceanicola sp.]
MKSSQLADAIAREVSRRIAVRELRPGDHLGAQALADAHGVSRSPIREALRILEKARLVEQRLNRGFYVSAQADTALAVAEPTLLAERDGPYQRMAEDWRRDLLPEDVTEQAVRDRYGLTKVQAQDILSRAQREGWAERKPGYGWRLLAVAKSPEAFRQIYEFRMVIEPAAMLAPDYAVVTAKVEELRAAQQRMLDHDIAHLPVEQLLGAGAHFHEELIKFSNNPNFHAALVRTNRMRRLFEYRASGEVRRFVEQCTQHLAILDLLQRGEVLEASYAMKKHLSRAFARKVEIMRERDGAQV